MDHPHYAHKLRVIVAFDLGGLLCRNLVTKSASTNYVIHLAT
jgi:hypothetical protein